MNAPSETVRLDQLLQDYVETGEGGQPMARADLEELVYLLANRLGLNRSDPRPLVHFLFHLTRDHLAYGTVAELIQGAENATRDLVGGFEFPEGHLGPAAIKWADRLDRPRNLVNERDARSALQLIWLASQDVEDVARTYVGATGGGPRPEAAGDLQEALNRLNRSLAEWMAEARGTPTFDGPGATPPADWEVIRNARLLLENGWGHGEYTEVVCFDRQWVEDLTKAVQVQARHGGPVRPQDPGVVQLAQDLVDNAEESADVSLAVVPRQQLQQLAQALVKHARAQQAVAIVDDPQATVPIDPRTGPIETVPQRLTDFLQNAERVLDKSAAERKGLEAELAEAERMGLDDTGPDLLGLAAAQLLRNARKSQTNGWGVLAEDLERLQAAIDGRRLARAEDAADQVEAATTAGAPTPGPRTSHVEIDQQRGRVQVSTEHLRTVWLAGDDRAAAAQVGILQQAILAEREARSPVIQAGPVQTRIRQVAIASVAQEAVRALDVHLQREAEVGDGRLTAADLGYLTQAVAAAEEVGVQFTRPAKEANHK